jgi:hypothetical protein
MSKIIWFHPPFKLLALQTVSLENQKGLKVFKPTALCIDTAGSFRVIVYPRLLF